MKLIQDLLEIGMAVCFITAGRAMVKGEIFWAMAFMVLGWLAMRTLQTFIESTK